MENYEQFRDSMILRDHLALDRTVLANHRTFLAFMRTFVGFFGGGAALIKLTSEPFFQVCGIIFAAVSPFFLGLGTYQYIRLTRKLRPIIGVMDKKSADNASI